MEEDMKGTVEDPSCASARDDSDSGSTIPGNCPTQESGQ